jgi:hypothetical protein
MSAGGPKPSPAGEPDNVLDAVLGRLARSRSGRVAGWAEKLLEHGESAAGIHEAQQRRPSGGAPD